MGSDSSDCVSLGELVGLCLFAGCDSSAIVSFVVRKTYLPKVLELACLRKGIHVAGGAPKEEVQKYTCLQYVLITNMIREPF